MTDDRDLTPVLRTWMREVPDVADRAGTLASVRARAHATPQVRRRPMTRRPPGMLSPFRLVAIIAIVTLGTGALFFAAGPGPSPAVSPSPSPTWSPPPGLVTQELAPGVLLATTDGAGHDLRTGADDGNWRYRSDLAFAPDGTLWMLGQSGLIHVGVEGGFPLPRWPAFDLFSDLTVDPDGTVWALSADTIGGPSVASFRDGAWTDAPPLPDGDLAQALEILPDGTVWVRSGTRLARLDGTAWTVYPIDPAVLPDPESEIVFPGHLAWTSDGSLWLVACGDDAAGALLRFDDSTFEPAAPVVPEPVCGRQPIVSGPGGELWWFVWGQPSSLARYDGTEWRFSPDDAGIPWIDNGNAYVGTMVADGHGRVWGAGKHDDAGPEVLGFFDGAAWTDVFSVPNGQMRLLQRPLKVAPDGTVWLLTGLGILIVDPEVAMAASLAASPAPTLGTEFDAGLVTEPVEPGVDLVLRDAAGHDLTNAGQVIAGADGSVWVYSQGAAGLFALGRPGTLSLPNLVGHGEDRQLYGIEQRLAVGPDGRLWASPGDRLASYDGSTWTTHPFDLDEDAGEAIEVGDDGTVWLVVGQNGRATSITRLDASGHVVRLPLDAYDPAGAGSVWLTGLAPTGDGGAWVGVATDSDGSGDARLLRASEAGMQIVDPPDGIDLAGMTSLDRGADGTLWIYLADRGDGPSLVRIDGERWEVFVDGVPHMGAPGASEGGLAAAPDGSVWVTVADQPIGLAHFDGERWARYLPGTWIARETSLAVGPDGTLWARAHDPDGAVFRIRP